MFSQGLVDIHQKLKEKYKPRLVRYVRLSNLILDNKNLEEIFDSLKNAPKQKQLLMGILDQNLEGHKWKNSKELLQKTSSTPDVLKTLISKGIFEEQSIREDRLLYDFKKQNQKRKLSKAQQKVFQDILNAFEEKSVVCAGGYRLWKNRSLYGDYCPSNF